MEEVEYFDIESVLKPSFYSDALFEQYEPLPQEYPEIENLYGMLAA